MKMSCPGSRTLQELGLAAGTQENHEIHGLSADSRVIRPGWLFAALPGSSVHGCRFIGEAIDKGASAIVTDAEGARALDAYPDAGAVVLMVALDPRQVFSRAAALWFGPGPDVITAVTGTNGKTSVTSFQRQIWEHTGICAASIGTLGVEGVISRKAGLTTPDPVTLHRLLAEARQAGATHAAVEASSHGLDQRRLDGLTLAVAGFTNLDRDHLDYHASSESYLVAKLRLFDQLAGPETRAVIDIDDPHGREEFLATAQGQGLQTLTVGRDLAADIAIIDQRLESSGQAAILGFRGQTFNVHLGLVGEFQLRNAALAAGMAIAAGGDAAQVFAALPALVSARGRMQLAGRRRNRASVFVDFAHTPRALEAALQTLRSHTSGRVVVVMGAGGDRDRGKRSEMGAVAARYADEVIVTDDNPRNEDPARIRHEILQGCPRAIEVADRAEAILIAVDSLKPGDVLMIAGKGHETGQTIGDRTYPFDDCEQASIACSVLDGNLA